VHGSLVRQHGPILFACHGEHGEALRQQPLAADGNPTLEDRVDQPPGTGCGKGFRLSLGARQVVDVHHRAGPLPAVEHARGAQPAEPHEVGLREKRREQPARAGPGLEAVCVRDPRVERTSEAPSPPVAALWFSGDFAAQVELLARQAARGLIGRVGRDDHKAHVGHLPESTADVEGPQLATMRGRVGPARRKVQYPGAAIHG